MFFLTTILILMVCSVSSQAHAMSCAVFSTSEKAHDSFYSGKNQKA